MNRNFTQELFYSSAVSVPNHQWSQRLDGELSAKKLDIRLNRMSITQQLVRYELELLFDG